MTGGEEENQPGKATDYPVVYVQRTEDKQWTAEVVGADVTGAGATLEEARQVIVDQLSATGPDRPAAPDIAEVYAERVTVRSHVNGYGKLMEGPATVGFRRPLRIEANPYLQGGAAHLRPSVVLFADQLGTVAGVFTLTDAEVEAQRARIETARDLLSDADMEDIESLVAFTDNVVYGLPAKNDDPLELGMALGFALTSAAWYQYSLAVEGSFIRGGVSIGDYYADRHFVTGPALIDAYKLESELAIVPRVVLSADAALLALAEMAHYAQPAESPWNWQLLVDADGRLFLDYLGGSLTDVAAPAVRAHAAQEHKAAVETALAAHAASARVHEKYVWVAEYHNFVCSRLELGDAVQIAPPAAAGLYGRVFRTLAGE